MTTIKDKILDLIATHGMNFWVFSACDFSSIAGQAVINDALATLCKRGKIRKLGKGLYDFPAYSKLLKKDAAPDPDQIAQALARKNHYPLLIDGLAAANSLGLTNAVPTQNIFFSDINPTHFSLAGWNFSFRKAGKKRLYWAGRKGEIAIQALWWLGRDILQNDRDKIIARLRSILPSAVKDDLVQGCKLKKTPGWMGDIIFNIATMG